MITIFEVSELITEMNQKSPKVTREQMARALGYTLGGFNKAIRKGDMPISKAKLATQFLLEYQNS